MPVQNAEIAAMLDQTGELLEIQGDNPFRARAVPRAGLSPGCPGRPGAAAKGAGAPHRRAGPDDLPGIGDDLAEKIAAMASTGRFEMLEDLKRALPGDLGDIAALPGVGPKRLKLLRDRLGVRSLDDLRRCAMAGRLRETKGLGAKLEAKLLAALNKPSAARAVDVRNHP